MARIPYSFHPQLNGFFPYGGFPDDPSKKRKPKAKIKPIKPKTSIKVTDDSRSI